MFGLFGKKIPPFDYGYGMGDDALQYTKPVHDGLMSYVGKWELTGFDQKKIMDDPYYEHMIRIYAAVAIFEFSVFQMRSFRVDTNELRRGFHKKMVQLAQKLGASNGDEYPLELDFISDEFRNHIEQNEDFSNTSLVFNEDNVDNCLLGGLLRKIAAYAIGASEIERELSATKYKNEMLESLRAFRILCQPNRLNIQNAI